MTWKSMISYSGHAWAQANSRYSNTNKWKFVMLETWRHFSCLLQLTSVQTTLLFTPSNCSVPPPKTLCSLSANMQVTMGSVHREDQLAEWWFCAATWEALKSPECREPLRDKERGTERTEGQMVHFSTSCVAVHCQTQTERKISNPSAKWYSFATFTKIRLHENSFFFILNVTDNLNNEIFWPTI